MSIWQEKKLQFKVFVWGVYGQTWFYFAKWCLLFQCAELPPTKCMPEYPQEGKGCQAQRMLWDYHCAGELLVSSIPLLYWCWGGMFQSACGIWNLILLKGSFFHLFVVYTISLSPKDLIYMSNYASPKQSESLQNVQETYWKAAWIFNISNKWKRGNKQVEE